MRKRYDIAQPNLFKDGLNRRQKIAQLKTEIASTTDAAALAEKNSMLSLAEKKLKDGDFFQWKKEDDLMNR